MTPEEKVSYIKKYFERMTASDIDGIISMFETEAYVLSPFLGKMPANDFFKNWVKHPVPAI